MFLTEKSGKSHKEKFPLSFGSPYGGKRQGNYFFALDCSFDKGDGNILVLAEELKLCGAGMAYPLVFVNDNILRFSAENTCRSVLLQDNAVFFGEDLNSVTGAQIHKTSGFDGKNYPPQLIDFSDHAK